MLRELTRLCVACCVLLVPFLTGCGDRATTKSSNPQATVGKDSGRRAIAPPNAPALPSHYIALAIENIELAKNEASIANGLSDQVSEETRSLREMAKLRLGCRGKDDDCLISRAKILAPLIMAEESAPGSVTGQHALVLNAYDTLTTLSMICEKLSSENETLVPELTKAENTLEALGEQSPKFSARDVSAVKKIDTDLGAIVQMNQTVLGDDDTTFNMDEGITRMEMTYPWLDAGVHAEDAKSHWGKALNAAGAAVMCLEQIPYCGGYLDKKETTQEAQTSSVSAKAVGNSITTATTPEQQSPKAFEDRFQSFVIGRVWNAPPFPICRERNSHSTCVNINGAPDAMVAKESGLRLTSAMTNEQSRAIATIKTFELNAGAVVAGFQVGAPSDARLALPSGTTRRNIDGVIGVELIDPESGHYLAASLFGGNYGASRQFQVESSLRLDMNSGVPNGHSNEGWQYSTDYRIRFASDGRKTDVLFQDASGNSIWSESLPVGLGYLGKFHIVIFQSMGTPNSAYYCDALVKEIAVSGALGTTHPGALKQASVASATALPSRIERDSVPPVQSVEGAMQPRFGNTVIAHSANTEWHLYFQADQSFSGREIRSGYQTSGTWELDQSILCLKFQPPLRGAPNPDCQPVEAHGIGDTWTSAGSTMTLVQGIQ